ncbi:glycerophosphoryl diester phosphodiesterase [Actinomadura rubrobrunea]|uniref:glycerophosphodiester phosphodiesterase n=1 Tax=Actinomadura rubrobrunea TaxID=115335 RepID=A0A9W6PV24_9ACTN|nr:glycerophosphodiester phosphodiesterase [Actinomadura rubrobrunea]GLW64350.1 glycerophosphoryl diester phosphodiesterase [Actinomadura rubrobrunea]
MSDGRATKTIRRRAVIVAGALLPPVLAVGAAQAAPSVAPAAPAETAAVATVPARGPLVLGHRGAAGYRPEHTTASYELAVRMGADYIEPDLVPTKDGVLVARHENEIGSTTDVAQRPEFASRKTTKTIDGQKVTGWFTEDFTLAELKSLRAVERLPDVRQHNTLYDGRYQVPTLQEVIDLAERLSREHHRRISIIPEMKHPTYFRSIGLPLEGALATTLKRNGLDRPDGRAIVQSFEPTSLRIIDKQVRVPLLQTISATGAPYDTIANGKGPTYAEMITPAGLKEVASYADWIGPDKNLVIPLKSDGSLGTPSPLVKNAHAAGLKVAPYTFRNENQFLPTDLRTGTAPGDYGKALKEYDAFYRAGIDALFSDNPDTAVIARNEFLGGRPTRSS